MKSWFPFTDYDFYAYLASGALALGVADLLLTGGTTLTRSEWTFAQIVLVIAGAYVAGQVIASASSLVLEYGLARFILSPPTPILLGLKKRNFLEAFAGAVLIGRYYEAFPEAVKDNLLKAAAKTLGRSPANFKDSEAVFLVAYSACRANEDSRERADNFRNQYAFCRNVAFVGLVSAALLAARMPQHPSYWMIALAIALGMISRFLKFYCAFAAEVLRALQR